MRNAPCVPASEAVSRATARRSGRKHRCEHSPALRSPRRAPKPERGSMPESCCFGHWNAVSYQSTRPTRRCSRPLRAEIVGILDGGTMRSRRLNGIPLGGSQSYGCRVLEPCALALRPTRVVLLRKDVSTVVQQPVVRDVVPGKAGSTRTPTKARCAARATRRRDSAARRCACHITVGGGCLGLAF